MRGEHTLWNRGVNWASNGIGTRPSNNTIHGPCFCYNGSEHPREIRAPEIPYIPLRCNGGSATVRINLLPS
jgi:hypothetical protein